RARLVMTAALRQIVPRQTEPQPGPWFRRRRTVSQPLGDHCFGNLMFVAAILTLKLPVIRLAGSAYRLEAGIHQRMDAFADIVRKRLAFEPKPGTAIIDNLPHAH